MPLRLAPVLVLLLFLGSWFTSGADAKERDVEDAIRILEAKAKEPGDQKDRSAAVRRLARIGGAEAAAALLPLFTDPFVHLRDHAVSAWIRMLKGDRAAETLSWLAKKALTHRLPQVRRGAVVALARSGVEGAGDVLAPRLQHKREKDARVLTSLLDAWGHDRSWRSSSIDLAGLVRHRDGQVALALADALLARGEATTLPPSLLDGLEGHRDPLARAARVLLVFSRSWPEDDAALAEVLADTAVEPGIALAEVLGGMPSEEVEAARLEDALSSLLAADAWRIRAAAIDAAVVRRRADAIPLLIERLSREAGRLRLDLADALESLTGKALGDDPELWSAWWEANAETFRVEPRPHPGRRSAGAEEGASDESGTRAAFFRLPIRSKRIAFLIDCSGSMRDPASADRPEGPTKMDLAREELERTLAALSPDTTFDVFLYRYPTVYPPKPEMTRALPRVLPATPANRKRAKAWLDREEPYGWGAFYDPLAHLLQGEEVDTIYFLSDGRPSRGTFDRGFRLLAELERANRFRRTTIHTVLVGTQKADREFLEDLARITGGRFVDGTR